MPKPKEVVKVTSWETFDGKEFNNEKEAEEYESILWAKLQENFRGINNVFKNSNNPYEFIDILDEGSSLWNEDDDLHGDWPSEKKKEGLMFLKVMYRIHKYLERLDRKREITHLF